jgi:lipoyl(octanoyl) transferase
MRAATPHATTRPAPGQQASADRHLVAHRMGVVRYADALEVQAELVRRRRAGRCDDLLLLLEHPHVITLGSTSHAEHVLLDAAARHERGIELFETGRGGDVTYHGPGQLVGYPILDLKPDRCDLHRYVRDIEQALIDALGTFDVRAGRVDGCTGVWVAGEKVAAIGVRVSSGWITSHGFALNADPDLSYFSTIIPCGIRDRGVTSLARLLGKAPETAALCEAVEHAFAAVFGRLVTRGDGRPTA